MAATFLGRGHVHFKADNVLYQALYRPRGGLGAMALNKAYCPIAIQVIVTESGPSADLRAFKWKPLLLTSAAFVVRCPGTRSSQP